jgi:hypothetical protein
METQILSKYQAFAFVCLDFGILVDFEVRALPGEDCGENGIDGLVAGVVEQATAH